MATFQQKVKLVFVNYDSRELGSRRDGFGGDPKANAKALKDAGIQCHPLLRMKTLKLLLSSLVLSGLMTATLRSQQPAVTKPTSTIHHENGNPWFYISGLPSSLGTNQRTGG